jgi:hypothetical protein
MSGRGTQYAGRVGLRPSVDDALSGLVRPLGAFERMFHLNEQKSTKHFCVVAELADDVDPFALAGALPAVQRRHPLLNVDVRAVRGSAVFSQLETGLGLIPAGSGSQPLPRQPSDLEPTRRARDGRVAKRACGECPRRHDFPRGCLAGLSTHGRHGAEQAPPRTPNNDGGGR